MNYTLKKLAELFSVEIIGDDSYSINKVASIENADEDSLVFLAEKKFLKLLNNSRSKTVITTKSFSHLCKNNVVVCDNPYLLFAKISLLLNKNQKKNYGIHRSVTSLTEKLNTKLSIDSNVYIGKNVQIGDDSTIGANCCIGDNIIIGNNACIYPNVTFYSNVIVGDNVVIHSGAVIGSDGFGFVKENNMWIKIPQIGGVIIGNDVEIGSNTSIDRGTLDNTVIGNGVKLDNQIQIAHNVRIGDHTIIAACVGIAGSAKIGRNCSIGGGAGIQGHIEICDNTQVTSMTKVSSSIKVSGIYTSGTPHMLNKKWLKNAVRFKSLNELFLKNKVK